VELLPARGGIESVALTPEHVDLARDAGEPLLYKGADFAQTNSNRSMFNGRRSLCNGMQGLPPRIGPGS
jgi:hypothetical protein